MLPWESLFAQDDSEIIFSRSILVFFVALVCVLLLQFLVSKKLKLSVFSESSVTLMFGIFLGGLVVAFTKHQTSSAGYLGFSSEIFFYCLLPSIVFNSGFHVHSDHFFKNIVGILNLAVIGTIISTIIVGVGVYVLGYILRLTVSLTFMEAMTFGALISTTDTVSTLAVFSELKVDPTLFYLVFGESVRSS